MAHPKGLLIERLKKQGVAAPEFRTANTGPDHEPTFLTDVVVEGEVYGTGQGNTKREAERLAAEEALAYLDRNPLELEAAAGKTGSKRQPQEQAQAKSQPRSKSQSRTSRSKPEEKAAKDQKGDGKPEKAAAKSGADSIAGQTRTASRYDEGEPAERFEGPWPVFENLLAGIVEVAGERVDEDLTGEEARVAIRDFTLDLYKDLLEDLGDVVEDDEE